jgi:AraC family transcriptional activator of pobA
MSTQIPVYSIHNFQKLRREDEFYANQLNAHVKEHHFTHLPHKHDFYLVVLITKGSGRHEIDFESYEASPGMVFLLKPGQMHYWSFSDDIEGFVFFHSRDFYDNGYLATSINHYPFYSTNQNPPFVQLNEHKQHEIAVLMSTLVAEHANLAALKWLKIHALISLIYIEITREYTSSNTVKSKKYLDKMRQFEDLVEMHFKEQKFVKNYADLLHITEKHLNRVTKDCINKTSTQLISERIILEAKRLLIYGKLNVSEISDTLGFNESSYFIRFFKKNTGFTPLEFLKHQQQIRVN